MSKLNPMRLGTPRAYQNIPQVGEVSQDLDVCTGKGLYYNNNLNFADHTSTNHAQEMMWRGIDNANR